MSKSKAKWVIAILIYIVVIASLIHIDNTRIEDHKQQIYDIKSHCIVDFIFHKTGKKALRMVPCDEYRRWQWRHVPNWRWYLWYISKEYKI